MTIGLIIFAIAILMIAYAYLSYKRVDHNLADIKQEDLVSYYLELFYDLLPVPVWSGILGVVLLAISLVVIIVNIPMVF